MQLIRRICISSIIHCFTGSSLLYLDHKTNLEVKIMGILFILLLTLMESTLLYLSLHGKRNFEEERGILNFSILLLLVLFFLTGVFTWSFRFMPITLLVALKSLVSLVGLLRRREKSFRKGKTILKAAVSLLLYITAASVLILFPPYLQPEVTGTFEVKTEKYTWIDEDRKDAFSTEDSRRLTVELYYPETSEGNYPLVVFSHGAFGFSGSNYSTFAELASHGYVVASIGHTGHAFYTLDTSGTLTTVDPDFISKAAEINGITDTQHEAEIFETTQSWLKLRVEDEHFVLERILEEASSAEKGTVFSLIDCENIGLMGHSLGGATSAEIGRLRPDIDAVIVLDGTMLGEEERFENGSVVLDSTPYPVPLLNIYAEDHYRNALTLEENTYSNFYASARALDAYETVFEDTGHLNFTDLPLFSPILAKALGVGDADSRECINTMNQVVLDFFDSCLKGEGRPIIKKEY
ncbi:MAG: hypothetical protein EOM07_05570 [Clostridia bacterium]|nr:hypothetical protein [Clostridia bacterium]